MAGATRAGDVVGAVVVGVAVARASPSAKGASLGARSRSKTRKSLMMIAMMTKTTMMRMIQVEMRTKMTVAKSRAVRKRMTTRSKRMKKKKNLPLSSVDVALRGVLQNPNRLLRNATSARSAQRALKLAVLVDVGSADDSKWLRAKKATKRCVQFMESLQS